MGQVSHVPFPKGQKVGQYWNEWQNIQFVYIKVACEAVYCNNNC